MAELEKMCRNEKDLHIRIRGLAVRMVLVRNRSMIDTARDLMQTTAWVKKWVARFEEKGVDGIYGAAAQGREIQKGLARLRMMHKLGLQDQVF